MRACRHPIHFVPNPFPGWFKMDATRLQAVVKGFSRPPARIVGDPVPYHAVGSVKGRRAAGHGRKGGCDTILLDHGVLCYRSAEAEVVA